MKFKFIATHLLGITALVTASFANANLIVNGDFEEPQLGAGAWQVFGAINGWTTTSGSGIEIQNNTIVTAQSGNQYVELDSYSNSSMTQMISGLITGQAYDVSFWYHARTSNGSNDNGINMLWGDSSPGIEVLSIDNIKASDQLGWVEFSRSLTATAATMYLTFSADGLNNSLGGFVDNVQMSSAVPEPAALGLFVCGLLGLARMRRKA